MSNLIRTPEGFRIELDAADRVMTGFPFARRYPDLFIEEDPGELFLTSDMDDLVRAQEIGFDFEGELGMLIKEHLS